MSARNIVQIGIPSSHVEQSGRFYSGLLGWKITPMPETDYAFWEPPEGPAGGFSPIGSQVAAGQVPLHVASDDTEADLECAQALGGMVLRLKTEIPGVGWRGILRDPSGNRVALFKTLGSTSASG